jgi:hypothetical protein
MRRIVVSLAVIWLGLVALPALAASLQQDLDGAVNNKDLRGYKVKGWRYEPEKREFLVYVHDGDKWLLGRSSSSLFPPAAAVVIAVDDIFSSHSVRRPAVYISQESSRELFTLDSETILEMIKDIQMSRSRNYPRRRQRNQP